MKPQIKVRAKLNILTRESVNAISLISALNLGLDIEYSLFTSKSLGIPMYFLPYHYFRLYFFKDDKKKSFKLEGFDYRYPVLYIDI